MQSVKILKFGNASVLKALDVESPNSLGRGDVEIDVRACGVNFADLMMRMGLYPEAPPVPFVPGYEVAGVIRRIGSSVTHIRVGDRVVAGTKFGGYTSLIQLPEKQVRPLPKHLSFAEGASIPVNFLTAGVALWEMGRVRSKDRVLVFSAAGGVGLAATQIAAQAGAHVIGLVSTQQKASEVLRLGAKEVWTYDEWDARRAETLGTLDIVLDPVGGTALKDSYSRLAPGGRVITFGASSIVSGSRRSLLSVLKFFLATPRFSALRLMDDNRGVFGLNALKLFELPILDRVLNRVMDGFSRGEFQVVVGKAFSLEDSGQAHDYLESRKNVGKVVLEPRAAL